MEDEKTTLQQSQTADAIFQEAETYCKQENYIKAYDLYLQAAAQKHKGAQLKLAWMYEHGKGVSKNSIEAQYWRDEAKINQKIEQPSSFGLTGSTNIYKIRVASKKKEYVHQDIYYDENNMTILTPSFAAILAQKKGGSSNKNLLGQATNKAGGKDKLSNKYKPKQKIYNLERMKITALQGNVYVQHQLGNIYNYGLGVKIDFLEAFKWYKEAAMNGYVPAQTNLGMFYARGKGVEKNEEAAMYWYKKAADYGDSLAKKILLVKNKKDKTPEDTKNKRNKKKNIKNKNNIIKKSKEKPNKTDPVNKKIQNEVQKWLTEMEAVKKKKMSGKPIIGSLGIAMLDAKKYKEQFSNLSSPPQKKKKS